MRAELWSRTLSGGTNAALGATAMGQIAELKTNYQWSVIGTGC